MRSNSSRPLWFRFYSIIFDRYLPLMWYETDGSYNRRSRPFSLPQEMNSGKCSACWSILHVGLIGAWYGLAGFHDDDDDPNGSTTPGNSLDVSYIDVFYRSLHTALCVSTGYSERALPTSCSLRSDDFDMDTPCFSGIFSDTAIWRIVYT
jgi:hypothetical protein